jgi:hypothetical protein
MNLVGTEQYNLKHEQNELYFAEKSFRLTLEKQPGRHNNESSNSARTISTCSSIHPLCSEDSLDSVFTQNDHIGIMHNCGS